ncbi:hypothetical protein B0H13DRAFT_1861634 [Mycena leptocephala]|nr:hypothetical protein B0H13DRAFT_1861634 [Mycena leptocephala]
MLGLRKAGDVSREGIWKGTGLAGSSDNNLDWTKETTKIKTPSNFINHADECDGRPPAQSWERYTAAQERACQGLPPFAVDTTPSALDAQHGMMDSFIQRGIENPAKTVTNSGYHFLSLLPMCSFSTSKKICKRDFYLLQNTPKIPPESVQNDLRQFRGVRRLPLYMLMEVKLTNIAADHNIEEPQLSSALTAGARFATRYIKKALFCIRRSAWYSLRVASGIRPLPSVLGSCSLILDAVKEYNLKDWESHRKTRELLTRVIVPTKKIVPASPRLEISSFRFLSIHTDSILFFQIIHRKEQNGGDAQAGT